MATTGIVLNTAPQAVNTILSLSAGADVTLQNITTTPMFLHESAAAPNSTEEDTIVLSIGALFNYRVGASENLYAWVRSGTARLVVTGA